MKDEGMAIGTAAATKVFHDEKLFTPRVMVCKRVVPFVYARRRFHRQSKCQQLNNNNNKTIL